MLAKNGNEQSNFWTVCKTLSPSVTLHAYHQLEGVTRGTVSGAAEDAPRSAAAWSMGALVRAVVAVANAADLCVSGEDSASKRSRDAKPHWINA